MDLGLEYRGWPKAIIWAMAVGSVIPLAAGEAPVQEHLEVVDQSIDFHGGKKFQQSFTELEMCSKSGCYELGSRIDGGLFELEVEGPATGHRRRVRITNDTAELWQDGIPVELNVADSRSIRSWAMARIYFVFLPFRLNDESVFKQDQGTEVWGQRLLRKVKVSFVSGSSSGADDEFLFWFDPDSDRLEQFAYSFAGDPGGLRFRRAFNFRRVGGILFFDQENWGVDGPGLAVDRITPDEVSGWTLISTVTVDEIRVSGLEEPGK